jgi:hypothetical protein
MKLPLSDARVNSLHGDGEYAIRFSKSSNIEGNLIATGLPNIEELVGVDMRRMEVEPAASE